MATYPFSLKSGVGNINLNDGIRYVLQDFDLGDTNRDESWIEPWFNPNPILANKVNRKTKLTLTLEVTGHQALGDTATLAKLIQNVEAVQAEFDKANTLIWAFDGVTFRTVQTFDSALAPVPVSGDAGLLIMRNLIVSGWRVEIWRHPSLSGASAPLMI